MASLLTLGLWSPVWLGLVVQQWVRGPEPWRCAVCGELLYEHQ